MTLVLKLIEEEAEDCRKAFEGVEIGSLVLHCHHEVLSERLSESAGNRIAYILDHKPRNERALRLRLFRPVSQDAINRSADRQKAYADCQKADADRQKAYADLQKAYADRQKADADRQKAYADWQKAYADRQKAYADRQKADADRQKADADCQKADADRQKAYADLRKACVELGTLVHLDVCKDCPWDGQTIFPSSHRRTLIYRRLLSATSTELT